METNIAFLCADISRLFRKKFTEAARNTRSTGEQWRAMLALQHFPAITQGALAEYLDVEPITVCRMVDRLEQSGLVRRERDPSDRRVWQLFLTEAAGPVIEDLREVGNHMLKQASGSLSDEEMRQVENYLMTIRDNIIQMDLTPMNKEADHG